jgi:aminopeptidase
MKMEFIQKLNNYADAIIVKGVNLQKGQRLEINSSIENHELAKLIMKKAFERGAADVIINWVDFEAGKIKYQMAPKEVFETVAEWEIAKDKRLKEEEWCIVNISTPDPEIFKDVDPAVIGRAIQVRSKVFEQSAQLRMRMEIKWCIALAASTAWAKKVYPESNATEAMERLWEAIFKCSRVDTADYIESWNNHVSTLERKYKLLNNKQYKKLTYKAPGTDLNLKPLAGAKWIGGGTLAYDQSIVLPNIPTEEIFTIPNKYSVNGKVSSTMPLVYNGNVIKNLWFEFKDGKVADFGAEEGKEVMAKFLETDEGAKYLGEVALVPVSSPISQLKTIFFNTLYDENASCHLALGNAVGMCLDGVGSMTKEEKEEIGFNNSTVHLDFMIGSDKLEIVGTLENGQEELIFKSGEWAI